MLQLDYRDRQPLYLQIAENFRRQILSGIMQVGEKLPSVRELSSELSINPNTIQRAYRDLEAEGWIFSVPGKGSFVAENDHGIHRRQELLEQLGELVTELNNLGLSQDEIIQFIQKGECNHA